MNSSQTFIIGIGASAGGLDAIQGFFDRVPSGLPCTFIVLQHQRGEHHSLLADLLRQHCSLPVRDADDGERPHIGTITVTPPANDITFEHDGTLRLNPVGREQAWYPIDRLFESMAREFGERALGVVLSGAGSDGTLGARALKDGGGTVFVQEPSSAGFDGMPNATITAGLADLIGHPSDLARQLVALCQGECEATGHVAAAIPDHIRHQILATLRNVAPTDFSYFNDQFVDQRIGRRMRVNRILDAEEYLRQLTQTSSEQISLGKDLTLRVAEFFNQDATLEALPRHFRDRLAIHPPGLPFRVWVPGCCTGEEAVSIAIQLVEALDDTGIDATLQVFASDFDESALQIARKGVYPHGIASHIDPTRLNRFFERTQYGWQVSRAIRNQIVFARHDISIDPPYTRLDFIACRNLLGDYRTEVQRNILERMRYALRNGGEILLGDDEGIATDIPGLEALAEPAGLIRKAVNDERLPGGWTPVPRQYPHFLRSERGIETAPSSDLLLTEFLLEELLLGRAAAALVVDSHCRVQAAHGELDRFLLQLPDGKLPLDDLTVPELRAQTLAAIRDAGQENAGARYDHILLSRDNAGKRHLARVSARRIQQGGQFHDLYTVVFESTPLADADGDQIDHPPELLAAEYKARFLEQEQKQTRQKLRSANHELQGIREQLNTTRGELLNTNDRIASIGRELEQRSARLHEVSLDYDNLLREIDTGILILDMDSRVLRFTPPFDQVLGLTANAVGSEISQLDRTATRDALTDQIDYCLDTLKSSHVIVQTGDAAFDVRISPYRKPNNAVDGILLRAHRMRQRNSDVDALDYLPALLSAYEQLYVSDGAATSVLLALEQISTFEPIAFAAYLDTTHTFVRPSRANVSREAFHQLSSAAPESVRFVDERDIRVHVDGIDVSWAVLVKPRPTSSGPHLLVGSTDPNVFCDGFINRLLGFTEALFCRLRS